MAEEDRKISTYETYVSSPNERTVLVVRPRYETWTDRIGLKQIYSLNFWRCVLMEFVVTLIFVMFTCGSTLRQKSDLHHGVCVGLLVAVLIAISNEMGGYFNPAITFGLLISRRMKYVRFFFYVAAQIAGGLSGAGLLYLYTPKALRGNLGVVVLHDDVSDGVGFVMEMTTAFVLVLAVLSGTDSEKKYTGFQPALVIGLAVTVCVLFGIPFTGAAVNPIRAFAPGVIMNQLDDQWIYWVGPLVGALLAALTFEYVFKLRKEKPKHDLPTVQVHINANSTNTTDF